MLALVHKVWKELVLSKVWKCFSCYTTTVLFIQGRKNIFSYKWNLLHCYLRVYETCCEFKSTMQTIQKDDIIPKRLYVGLQVKLVVSSGLVGLLLAQEYFPVWGNQIKNLIGNHISLGFSLLTRQIGISWAIDSWTLHI